MIVPSPTTHVPVEPAAVVAPQPPSPRPENRIVHHRPRGNRVAPGCKLEVFSAAVIVAYGPRLQMGKRARRLTPPERTIAICGIALGALSLVPWWGRLSTPAARLGELGRLPGATGTFDAYYGYGWTLKAAVVLGVGAAVMVLARKLTGVRFPPALYAAAGVGGSLLVASAIVRGPSAEGLENLDGVVISRGPLPFVALALCALIALAGLGAGLSRRSR